MITFFTDGIRHQTPKFYCLTIRVLIYYIRKSPLKMTLEDETFALIIYSAIYLLII